ncbi:MAG: hypothetical protein AB9879_10200 [Methanothrix sp.]
MTADAFILAVGQEDECNWKLQNEILRGGNISNRFIAYGSLAGLLL